MPAQSKARFISSVEANHEQPGSLDPASTTASHAKSKSNARICCSRTNLPCAAQNGLPILPNTLQLLSEYSIDELNEIATIASDP